MKSDIRLRNRALSEQKLIRYYRKKVFVLTFISYAISHLSRKAYTTCKIEIIEQNDANGINSVILSAMDTTFMFSYAIGNLLSGRLGDFLHGPTLIGIGLIGSSFCVWSLVVGILSSHLNSLAFIFLWGMNGFFQSSGGPIGTAIMQHNNHDYMMKGNWFGEQNRGWIFGLWTAHQYIGNISAALMTSLILHLSVDWTFALLIPALLSVLSGVVIIYELPDNPEEVDVETEESAMRALGAQLEGNFNEDLTHQYSPIDFKVALSIPNVLSYSLAFGFLKLINYVIFFWLPYLLSLHFTPQQSNLISILYDVGMLPGGLIVGSISDYCGGRRACVIAAFIILLVPVLWIFATNSMKLGTLPLLFLLFLMGILVGGPNNIITSAVAIDLAQHPSIRGNNKALGTVTGIISGTGSITAALGLLFIGPLQIKYGSETVWYFLIVCSCVATVLIFPKVLNEIYQHNNNHHNSKLLMTLVQPKGLSNPQEHSSFPIFGTIRNDRSNMSYQGYRYGAISCPPCDETDH